MGKRRRIELPEEIIHHILSFLSVKEAILSKSCYNAWLTRPNLVFVEEEIPKRHRLAFLKFANKTMKTHEKLNQKVRSLRLELYGSSTKYVKLKSVLAKKLIFRAMKLGATDLDVALNELGFLGFVLPDEVFESENLVRLSVDGAKIDLQGKKVNCLGLKSLSLSRVCIDGNSLWDIGSICPLIEELVLHGCDRRMWEMKPGFGLCVDNFLKLRVLLLEVVKIGEWFFSHISRCTFLKELTLHNCYGFTEIQICSNSLEFINLFGMHLATMSFKFNVPRIRKFKFLGNCVPSLSFKTTSKEWESDILIRCKMNFDGLKISLFHKLRQFLLELSPSKISLSLDTCISLPSLSPSCDHSLEMIPKVEKLTLLMYAPFNVHFEVLGNLFWSCHPKFVTLYWLSPPNFFHYMSLPHSPPYFGKQSRLNNDFSKLIHEKVKAKAVDHALPLEETNVEFFEDDVVAGCQLLSLFWKTLIEASTN